jgi:hypothetical protein
MAKAMPYKNTVDKLVSGKGRVRRKDMGLYNV